MKKFLALLLALTMALALVACGGGDDEAASAASPAVRPRRRDQR